ncbi:MAG TPA: SH3 domain-containing protein, partial [Candidatus Binatia bacterium]|nr:SH3 domain-containing protein [Candidatus Binatia bacterium]
GRVVTVAFIDAYTQMISQLGVLDTGTTAAASAPQQSYRTTRASQLRSRAGGGQVLRNLPAGAIVYPSGERDGVWWAVEDENQNQGWISNDDLEPVR